jgi:hypothetical protein
MHNKTAMTGLPGKDRKDRAARAGLRRRERDIGGEERANGSGGYGRRVKKREDKERGREGERETGKRRGENR